MNIPDVVERVHWEHDFAREVGTPGYYDYGPQRVSWLGNMLTNWIGDDGWLKRLSVQVRCFNEEYIRPPMNLSRLNQNIKPTV